MTQTYSLRADCLNSGMPRGSLDKSNAEISRTAGWHTLADFCLGAQEPRSVHSCGDPQFLLLRRLYSGHIDRLAVSFEQGTIAILTLLLAHRAVEFFSGSGTVSSASGHAALETVAFLIPLNFVFVSFSRERGFVLQDITRRLALLFFQSVFVAVVCRPGYGTLASPHGSQPRLVAESVPWIYVAAL